MTSQPDSPHTVYVVQAQPKGFSVTALVLALVSIVFGFTLILPLAALIFGIIGAKKEPAGRGMAIVGIVIGALDRPVALDHPGRCDLRAVCDDDRCRSSIDGL